MPRALPDTTRLYLLRHGEVATPDIHYGHSDLALSPLGQRQAMAAAGRLARLPLTAVYSSDLQRAAVGAQLVGAHHALQPRYEPALREMNLGVLEGIPHVVSRQQHPQLYAKRYQDLIDEGFPEGESLRVVAGRVYPAVDSIVARHRGQCIAIVAHNSANRIIIARALGLPLEQMFAFQQDYGCINWMDIAPDEARVGLLNWTPEAPGGEAGGGRHPP